MQDVLPALLPRSRSWCGVRIVGAHERARELDAGDTMHEKIEERIAAGGVVDMKVLSAAGG